MLDLIFAVDDAKQWHMDNLRLNWDHYSVARYLGPKFIDYIQRCNAGVYYNTMVKVENRVSYNFFGE